jgi:hypothetical protein
MISGSAASVRMRTNRLRKQAVIHFTSGSQSLSFQNKISEKKESIDVQRKNRVLLVLWFNTMNLSQFHGMK